MPDRLAFRGSRLIGHSPSHRAEHVPRRGRRGRSARPSCGWPRRSSRPRTRGAAPVGAPPRRRRAAPRARSHSASRGREDLVDDRDLARVDRPLAVSPSARASRARSRRPSSSSTRRTGRRSPGCRPRGRRRPGPGVDVVEVVARVAVGRAADRRDRDADRRAVVARAEDQRLHPRRGGGDRLAGEQPGGVLDLRLDADAAGLEAAAPARSG